MSRRILFALIGLLVGSAAHAAEPTGCVVRKGLYEAWLSSAKRSPGPLPRFGALLGSSRSSAEPASTQEIHDQYQNFFQCLSDSPLPADDEGGRSLCKEAAADRVGLLVCEVALYLKTNRNAGADFLDALPDSRKGAEMIWDLAAITDIGAAEKRGLSLFAPKGPAYKIIDEVFVLALDDRETAMSKYFHIVGAASGAGTEYTDSQIKILLRESPELVVKQWAVLRQYQQKLKKLLADLSTELSGPEMNQVRLGIAGFCSKDNLDCPEIQKLVGRPQ
jgi:hypothetical protein